MTKKIMLVDDSVYMRGILKRILREDGQWDVLEAADGEEAVTAYGKERPDVTLMDIVMPKKNGLDALREIRQVDAGARVIMVTAVGQDVVVEEAKQAGAVDFVVKPFEADEVRGVVRRVLEGGDRE